MGSSMSTPDGFRQRNRQRTIQKYQRKLKTQISLDSKIKLKTISDFKTVQCNRENSQQKLQMKRQQIQQNNEQSMLKMKNKQQQNRDALRKQIKSATYIKDQNKISQMKNQNQVLQFLKIQKNRINEQKNKIDEYKVNKIDEQVNKMASQTNNKLNLQTNNNSTINGSYHKSSVRKIVLNNQEYQVDIQKIKNRRMKTKERYARSIINNLKSNMKSKMDQNSNIYTNVNTNTNNYTSGNGNRIDSNMISNIVRNIDRNMQRKGFSHKSNDSKYSGCNNVKGNITTNNFGYGISTLQLQSQVQLKDNQQNQHKLTHAEPQIVTKINDNNVDKYDNTDKYNEIHKYNNVDKYNENKKGKVRKALIKNNKQIVRQQQYDEYNKVIEFRKSTQFKKNQKQILNKPKQIINKNKQIINKQIKIINQQIKLLNKQQQILNKQQQITNKLIKITNKQQIIIDNDKQQITNFQTKQIKKAKSNKYIHDQGKQIKKSIYYHQTFSSYKQYQIYKTNYQLNNNIHDQSNWHSNIINSQLPTYKNHIYK